MINFYKTQNAQTVEIDEVADGCWISVVAPCEKDIAYLINELNLESSFVRAALDDEEISRIEQEDDQTLLLVDVPNAEKHDEKTVVYSTTPLAFILTDKNIITITVHNNQVIQEFIDGTIRSFRTDYKVRFIFTVLLRIASRYLRYLKHIDKISSFTEKQLHRSMKNKELIQLLELEKSLVYFSTSLQANEVTIKKIMRGKIVKLYDDDLELLEDVLIEFRQAIEMCETYSRVMSSMMEAVGSIISNNLNIVMKVLTSLTVLITIPTLISGFYGMNVTGIPVAEFWFPVALSCIITGGITVVLIKKNYFN